MSQNILITGGAGYIGGSLVADIVSRPNDSFKAAIFATARSADQIDGLSKLGIHALLVNLRDKAAVDKAVLDNKIDIVVHVASSIVPGLASNLIAALGQRRQASGKDVYFVHSSVMNFYSEQNGWPYGEVKDTDPVFEKEKEMGGSHFGRATNVLVMEEAKTHGVVAFNVVVPTVYGRGTGPGRKLSASIPAYIRTSIQQKVVSKFEHSTSSPATHISDMTEFYILLLSKIINKETIPRGEKGYYFVMAHSIHWWNVMDRIAKSLHARGLVTEPKAQVWSSYETAADSLGWPRQLVRALGTSTAIVSPVNQYQLGWQPKWDEKRFLDSIDDEIEAVGELDTVKSTLFDSVPSVR